MAKVSDFLSSMASASLLRAERVRSRSGVTGLDSRASSARPPIGLRLSPSGFDLIAEAKLASPSEGRLAPSEIAADGVVEMSRSLASAGASAISVLTAPERFDGDIAHLEAVASSVDVPTMRKDFLVDPIQITEARAAGASGVLLIARILDEELLMEMTDATLDAGMFALVEIFDEGDLDVASAVFDRDVLVGVNARNLRTLAVDAGAHQRIRPLLPDHLALVAESGINSAADAADVARVGYRLALVGSALTKAVDGGDLAARMIEAGRSV